jgi:hypothetical protein
MREILESLSLVSGAALMAIASATLSVGWARLRPRALCWALTLVVPLLLAYSLYWAPFWLGANSDQADIWTPLAISAWGVAGIASSVLVVFLLGRRRTATLRQREKSADRRL